MSPRVHEQAISWMVGTISFFLFFSVLCGAIAPYAATEADGARAVLLRRLARLGYMRHQQLPAADNSSTDCEFTSGVRTNRACKIMHRSERAWHRMALGGSVMQAAVVPAVSSSWQVRS